MNKYSTFNTEGRKVKVSIPMREEDQKARERFKDAWYTIGDKKWTLKELHSNLPDSPAKNELATLIVKLEKAQDDLGKWADQNLQNWD